jgi:type I restriction enzyme S subunit
MASDLKGGGIDSTGCKFISLEQAKTLRKGFAQEGDVLLSHKATIGRTAIVGKIETDFVVLTPQVTYYRVLDQTKINPKYLKYYFDSVEFQRLFEQWAGGGSTRLYLGITGQMKLPIKLPNINIQNWIVKIVDSFDSCIQLNTKTNQTLEQMAQALFKSWFVDFDPVIDKALAAGSEIPDALQHRVEIRKKAHALQKQNPNIQPLPAATQRLFPSEFEHCGDNTLGIEGWIPKGWRIKKFKDVVDKYIDNRGKTPPLSDEGTPIIEVKNMPEDSPFPSMDSSKRVSSEVYNNWFRAHVKERDILISTVGTIGRTSYVKNTSIVIAQNVLGLRFGNTFSPEYMFYLIKSHKFQYDMDARLVVTVQASIKRKDLNTIDLLAPTKNVQILFESSIKAYLDAQYTRTEENKHLQNLRDLLLPKLISGEIQLDSKAQELMDA